MFLDLLAIQGHAKRRLKDVVIQLSIPALGNGSQAGTKRTRLGAAFLTRASPVVAPFVQLDALWCKGRHDGLV